MNVSGILWQPSPQRIATTNLTRFTASLEARHDLSFTSYRDLHAWSVRERGDFWRELARFADVRADWGTGPAVERGDAMPGARFFPGARLNFAENLLRYRDAQQALVFRNERGVRRTLSYAELHAEVARVAAGLAALGVVSGDRVAAFMPNVPETVIAMLAAASLGATFSSCSPDFGLAGVLDRFGQIAPKVLFTADGYCYAGKTLDSLATAAALAEKLPSLERVVVVPYVSERPRIEAVPRAVPYETLGTSGSGGAAAHLAFPRLPFDHPLYILYSSGTTGVPKCIVHGAGGTLLQHQKEHLLHTDLSRSDRLFYFTTCGWMMWNWLVSGLATGTTLILYDGSPFHPDPGALWRMAEEERITIFGTSAKYLAALEKSDFRPAQACDLGALRAVLSTGSPLAPEGFDFVYREVKQDLHLASISGGTDIVSCFVLGVPTLPVRRGEIQAPGLGMKMEVFDEAGVSVRGKQGELVCTAPFPSMPLGFWNDADGSRYRAAYFERLPGVWHHGDYAEITASGGFVISGRSDAVLNPGGVRIGTAEIYRQVEALDEVVESLAIGQEWAGDVRVVLFVRLRAGVVLDEALKKRIWEAIRMNTTPRHVPARIIAVADIPRTRSGKITELAVREVVHGRPVKNVEALANPEALALFRNLPELTD